MSRNVIKTLVSEALDNSGVQLWEYALPEMKKLEDDEGCLTEEDEDSEEDCEELDETSAMGGGAVAGAPGGAWGPPNTKNIWKDRMTELRQVIRSTIFETIKEKATSYMLDENKLRKYIRKVLAEGKSPTTANPHHMTGINVLETLMTNIMPTIEADYKTLTTSPEQRESFLTQFKHSLQNLLDQMGMNKVAGTDQDGDGDLDEELVSGEESEEPTSTTPAMRVVNDENPFIDVYGEADDTPEEAPEDPGTVDGIDPTGRGKSLETFGKVSKQIESEFTKLSDPRDIEAFAKYFMINMDMYGDKWEDEVGQGLSQIDAEPGEGDVVDAGDGLGPGEMAQGGPEEDPFMPNDLEEEWKAAQEMKVEFYSTSGHGNPKCGPQPNMEPDPQVPSLRR